MTKSTVKKRATFHKAPNCNSTQRTVTLNNASDYRANGLLSNYIGWTNGLSDYRANGLGLGVRYSPIGRRIIKKKNCEQWKSSRDVIS